MTRSFHCVSNKDIDSVADGTLRGKDKTILGVLYNKESPSGNKYLECKLEGFCIITNEEYKEYKQLKK